MLPSPEGGPERVRQAIEEILARPEFAGQRRSWLERARDWVFEQLGQVVDALLGSGAGSALGWAVAAVLALVAVVLAVRFSRGVRPDPGTDPGPTAGPRRSAVDWRANAARHEEAGEWRPAMRCRWRALVAELAGRGLLEEAPGRTAGEYRRQLSVALPCAATDFDVATGLFEAAWYGDRPTDADQVERLRSLAERVLVSAGTAS
ncbi:MAG: DUF4129 domain-containing protein [Acidimicrobiales bacterium]